ncbi:MAG: cysteine--tRNA ligase [Candidatus Omnitrophica bacterium CG11_big_fil_rev_8_21_14_0_20_45_26]|uniref:Cysteine--tRNA ligase n=1 Tax=Candidatus Abzuiibacterium crystallinum TaxID=1974748 RepID=A0A2H0LL67_9BACT|nr:MAG: cysteine--tRNA ligase [Candidatus Omnitrophica bacterium CG11_big_fil_rev_8_21_14_0_20_45_26]PIW63773.1 MAG: cysteine--tRNA ligase [Candidatus Omnitrophica bacterium CG12_big_fil_rev_8_21_14_0_65_45_16]
MTLQLTNTLTGIKENFVPLNPPYVRMYTCGPTVYDYAHIGNFRTYAAQDLLKRYLQYKGLKVAHVMNITDVDDKTIAGAHQKHLKLDDYTAPFIQAFHEDLKTLHILPPAQELRATQTIPQMVEMIQKLERTGHAYPKDGSVYFRISSFAKYGLLSKKDLEKNITGARVDQDEYEKETAMDFVLWKKAKEDEPAWDSPWGRGRPGWHTECSTMSLNAFKFQTLDIHTGGEDLIFPHHENEIAQSECATRKKFVNYWFHVKHLLVDGEKMAKSKGNFYTLRDLITKGHEPLAIRYVLISTHYRKQLNFTFDGLRMAKESINRVRNFCDALQAGANEQPSQEVKQYVERSRSQFEKALDNDLNAAEALSAVFDLIHYLNLAAKRGFHQDDRACILGFLNDVNRVFAVFSLEEESLPADVQALVEAREKARLTKDFKHSDELRKTIQTKGFTVKDTPHGPQVKKIL